MPKTSWWGAGGKASKGRAAIRAANRPTQRNGRIEVFIVRIGSIVQLPE
jgi:hypothetical protein